MRVKPKKAKVTFQSKDGGTKLSSQRSGRLGEMKGRVPERKMASGDTGSHYDAEDEYESSGPNDPQPSEDTSMADASSSLCRISESPIPDPHRSQSLVAQLEVVELCMPLLAAEEGTPALGFNRRWVPRLNRDQHVEFLENAIENARFTGLDASRPWVVYWCLTGLSLLGKNVEVYRERVVQTFAPAQNEGGGFGGGHGQLSHLAPSYAVVLSLAMVGESESLDLIDRRSLWKWLGQVKQIDGGFSMCVGGEEDVRGAYCAATIISLLSLPLDLPSDAPARAHGLTSLLDGLPEYLSRCQTFEGGISGKPQSEAHGSYAFCALACLCILGPPQEMLPKYLDLPLLISWLAARQYAPEGGFSGRTNKLVDGCYSHWVGGCWPLITAALNGPQSNHNLEDPYHDSFYSEELLIRYIMACCQAEGGGLRDKPEIYPDGYHSCYVLAGLSSLQYFNDYAVTAGTGGGGTLDWATHWMSAAKDLNVDEQGRGPLINYEDLLAAVHPLYVIPFGAADRCHHYFGRKEGF